MNTQLATPPVLVQTWIMLIKSDNVEVETKQRALKMLREKIGTPVEIANFIKQHNISV